MYCQSCGNEISVELKYCNRCGANLSQGMVVSNVGPPRLTAPTLVLGLTIVGGLGVIFAGSAELAGSGIHPTALTWIILFSMATLFGITALLLRFWSHLITLQRQIPSSELGSTSLSNARKAKQLPPRLEPVGSVTEHTTRTFVAPPVRDRDRS